MALSARAYARHRGVSHTAVQKALRAGRITALPDGTINPEVADQAWNAAGEARGATEQIAADPTRVMLPAGSLATAEATVRAVLAQLRIPGEAERCVRLMANTDSDGSRTPLPTEAEH